MRRLVSIQLLLIACRAEPPLPPPPPPPPTPPTLPPSVAPVRPAGAPGKGAIVEPRTVTSSREASGEIREQHHRDDGSLALEVFYRDQRTVRVRASDDTGRESWACEVVAQRPPVCVVRDRTGEPLSNDALAARNYDARQRLESARKLLAPPDPEHDGHEHSHFKVPPPTEEAAATWEAKRSRAWKDAEPWFHRVELLQTLGLPMVVATRLAKEELSSGFWIVPVKRPIGPSATHER